MLNVVDVQCREYYGDFSMNVFNIVIALMVQHRRFGANISMDVFAIENALMMQRRRFSAGIPMNVYTIMYALMVQLGTSCSFGSPGLARNEPTPGEYPQGDSTPSVLSFLWESMVMAIGLMADYA